MSIYVPSALESSGYERTIQEVREAFERRLSNQRNDLPVTPSFHRGMPDFENLPNEPIQIWLDYRKVGRTVGADVMGAFAYTSEWYIAIIGEPDAGHDPFSTHSDIAERVWTAVTASVTATAEDLGMDGSTEYIEQPEWEKTPIRVGDRRVVVYEGRVLANHLLELVLPTP